MSLVTSFLPNLTAFVLSKIKYHMTKNFISFVICLWYIIIHDKPIALMVLTFNCLILAIDLSIHCLHFFLQSCFNHLNDLFFFGVQFDVYIIIVIFNRWNFIILVGSLSNTTVQHYYLHFLLFLKDNICLIPLHSLKSMNSLPHSFIFWKIHIFKLRLTILCGTEL
jgi:hypothetical protein